MREFDEKQKNSEFDSMSDSDIATMASRGNSRALDYLLNKYKKFAKNKARSYFLIGADNEDIVQEGMIGLYKAIRDFNPDKQASFYSFADLCITRQIITAIKTATRKKHLPLNSYVSLNEPMQEDSEITLIDLVTKSSDMNPVNIIINEEDKNEIEKKMNEILSDLEWEVLNLYLQGKSYSQMSMELKTSEKTIDNAMQRTKRKLDKYLKTRKK